MARGGHRLGRREREFVRRFGQLPTPNEQHESGRPLTYQEDRYWWWKSWLASFKRNGWSDEAIRLRWPQILNLEANPNEANKSRWPRRPWRMNEARQSAPDVLGRSIPK